MKYEQEVQFILELADEITSNGFIVYIASRKNYGFFTDCEGKAVVSFGFNGGNMLQFHGNYQPNRYKDRKQIGTGWFIPEGLTYRAMLDANPPQWATEGKPCKKTNLEEHLESYNLSSGYSVFQSGN